MLCSCHGETMWTTHSAVKNLPELESRSCKRIIQWNAPIKVVRGSSSIFGAELRPQHEVFDCSTLLGAFHLTTSIHHGLAGDALQNSVYFIVVKTSNVALTCPITFPLGPEFV